MHIRCLHCKGVTWYDPEGELSERGPCQWCQRLDHPARRPPNVDRKARHRAVLKLAESNRIDLPSANSILIGLMTLQQALAIQGLRNPKVSPSEKGAGAQRGPGASQETWGDRLRTKRRTGWTEREKRLGLLSALGMLLAAVGMGLSGWNNWQHEVATAQALEGPPAWTEQAVEVDPVPRKSANIGLRARVLRDRKGRIVQITASRPEAVLRAFCTKGDAGGQIEPVELTSTNPDRVGARIDILRDYRDLANSYGLWIRRRPLDRQWTVGDGRRPVRPFVVEPERIGDLKIPVSLEDEPGLPG